MSLASTVTSIVSLYDGLYQFIFYTWPFLLFGVLMFLRKRWKKYPIEAVIVEKRGENLIKTNDRVGIIREKSTGITSYRLLKAKDSIPVMNYEWILHNKSVNTNFLERIISLIRGNTGTVFLFRYGSKQYKPVYINQKNPGRVKKLVPIKTKKGEKRYIYQYSQFDPRWILGALDFDVIDWDNMNFMVQEQRATIERRQKKGDRFLALVVPIVIIAASVLISLFIIKFSYDFGLSMRGSPAQSSSEGGSKVLGAIQGTFTPGE